MAKIYRLCVKGGEKQQQQIIDLHIQDDTYQTLKYSYRPKSYKNV